MQFLHWFKHKPIGSQHYIAVVESDGTAVLTEETTGELVSDDYLLSAFDDWFCPLSENILPGKYPLDYDPQTGKLTGPDTGHTVYHVIHNQGMEPRLMEPDTCRDVEDPAALAALAIAMNQVNPDLDDGTYVVHYDPDATAFHGFGGGDSGGGGATDSLPLTDTIPLPAFEPDASSDTAVSCESSGTDES